MVGILVLYFILVIAFALFLIAAQWKIYEKAGKEGWAAIVPIYNIIVLQEIVGRPAWWTVLYFVPFVNYAIAIINIFDLAKSFGKGTGFGFLLLFFPVIGFPMLGFGDAKYVGPVADPNFQAGSQN